MQCWNCSGPVTLMVPERSRKGSVTIAFLNGPLISVISALLPVLMLRMQGIRSTLPLS